MVLFKRIEGFENYWISMEGDVYSAKSDKILKQRSNGRGYLCTSCCGKTEKNI